MTAVLPVANSGEFLAVNWSIVDHFGIKTCTFSYSLRLHRQQIKLQQDLVGFRSTGKVSASMPAVAYSTTFMLSFP